MIILIFLINLNRVTIAKIENNQRAISLEGAVNISKVFLIDVDSLYGYISDTEDENTEEELFARGILFFIFY